jgi:thymidylate synthase
MFRVFSEATADRLWQKLFVEFESKGKTGRHAGRGGETEEILHAALSITDPRQRWVTSRMPALNPAFAVAEIVWILAGRNDSYFLNYFNSQLPKFAGFAKTYHGAYGHRIRKHLGLDQFERAYSALRKNPESRQIVLQIWDSRIDLPTHNGRPVSPDIPCNIVSMLKIRNGALEWTQVMRSNDLFRGLPHNIVQFTTLQEVMAGWIGVELGTYNQVSDSLHIYHDDRRVFGSVPSLRNRNLDSLMLPKRESTKAIAELERIISVVIRKRTKVPELVRISGNSALPPGFRNLACVICAEGARRRRALPEMDHIMNSCSNLCLGEMFNAWKNRLSERKGQ